MIFLIYFLTLYGISNILVYANGPFRIFEHYRQLMDKMPSNIGEGAHCMICTPTQLGILFSIMDLFVFKSVSFTPFNILYENLLPWYIIILLDGVITSGTVWLIHTFQEYFEKEEEIYTEEEDN